MDIDGRSEPKASGLRVLLVEDENLVALLLEEMLDELGYRVIGPAARLDQAMKIAECETLDLAVLDVNINGKETYPVADALTARGIPFVFATGYGRGSLRSPYRNGPVLQKPFRLGDVQKAIAVASGGSCTNAKSRSRHAAN